MTSRSIPLLIIITLLASGCVTHIKTDLLQNPPPAEKFANFAGFELQDIRLVPPYAGQEANEKALVKIQQNLSLRTMPMLEGWNRSKSNSSSRTLLIEPTVTEIKFINATSRVWTGAMAGSSAVILRAKISEKETGRVIAEPHFYARAAAYSGHFPLARRTTPC